MGEQFEVLVPLKRLENAKSRLADVLSPVERSHLMCTLVGRVAGAASRARDVSLITLVTSEPTAASLAAAHGLAWWHDAGLPWNDAIAVAMRYAVNASTVVILSADLPLLAPEDIDALVAALPRHGIAIGRAHDGGTNALAMRPPGLIMPRFGVPLSAKAHIAQAREARVTATVVDRRGLAFDLDTESDLERLELLGGAAWPLLDREHVRVDRADHVGGSLAVSATSVVSPSSV